MGELIPLPVARCPWRRKEYESDRCEAWKRFLFDVSSLSGFEMDQRVQVQSGRLSALRMIMIAVFAVFYLSYQFYAAKGYLQLAPIQGTARLQLQHPVKDNCNPLKEGCQTRYRSLSELPYCTQYKGATNLTAAQRETCSYFDEFDLLVPEVEQTKHLITTRRTFIKQSVHCNALEKSCPSKYEITNKETSYTADIESFTLLVDHSFICPELRFNKTAYHMKGFYIPCLSVGDKEASGLDAVTEALSWQPSDLAEECGRVPIDVGSSVKGAPAANYDPAVLRQWAVPRPNGSKTTPSIYKVPSGDVIRIGPLLRELGINLDGPGSSSKDPADTLRRIGSVLVIEVSYHNFKLNTPPNRHAPIYQYNFKLLPNFEYKVTKVLAPPSNSERLVDVRYGLYISVKQHGMLGKATLSAMVLIILEIAVFMGLVKWVVSMLAINMWPGQKGDDFEKLVMREVQFDKQARPLKLKIWEEADEEEPEMSDEEPPISGSYAKIDQSDTDAGH